MADGNSSLSMSAWPKMVCRLMPGRYLSKPVNKSSTRLDFRPFSIAEQEKILAVSACLTCHDNNSEVMGASLNSDFNRYLKTISAECKVPNFD
jgi:hypothetical protein